MKFEDLEVEGSNQKNDLLMKQLILMRLSEVCSIFLYFESV